MNKMEKCRVCGGFLSSTMRVREMMFGTRDEFDYHQCETCGCLQIAEIPEDIEKYYPEDYYSFEISHKRERWVRDFIRKKRGLYAIENKGFIGALFCAIKDSDPIYRIYGRIGLTRKDAVLDVGGGGGRHVNALRYLGFEKALAIDPFIDSDGLADSRILVKKLSIFDVEKKFDLITFHHSFEHMYQQQQVLAKARNLLTINGKILIRIPTVSSTAFETYGPNWANLDAPRHFYLHSHKSISIVSEAAGLQILDLWCDSVAFQFWASEQYAADIPLNDPRSYTQNPLNSLFTGAQIAECEANSIKLNHKMQGDSICVVLSDIKNLSTMQ